MSANPQTSPTASNRWNLTVPAGTYDFYATWVSAAGNATNAGFAVYDGFTNLGTFQANQQLTPGDGQFGGMPWAKQGTITVASGKLTIAMSASGANGEIVADGILLTAESLGLTAIDTGGMGMGGGAAPAVIPMGQADTSGQDQGGGSAMGTSSPIPIAVTPSGAAASPAPIPVAYAVNPGTGPDAETPPSTSPSPSLTDHAIAEMGKHHPRKHRKAILERLARLRAAHRQNHDSPHPKM